MHWHPLVLALDIHRRRGLDYFIQFLGPGAPIFSTGSIPTKSQLILDPTLDLQNPFIILIPGGLHKPVFLILICVYSVLIWKEIFDPPPMDEIEANTQIGKIMFFSFFHN